MGFFGGDNDQSPSQGDQLLTEQINQNKAELAAKQQSLFQTRLDIIKGNNAEQWTPGRSKRASQTPTPSGQNET
jgi:hypothetical protein